MTTIAQIDTTIAEQISALYGDDGQCLRIDRSPATNATLVALGVTDLDRIDDDGIYRIADVCGSAARVNGIDVNPRSPDCIRYTFRDGSAIVIAGGAWDLAIPDSADDCWCWGSGDYGRHNDGCRYAE